MVTVRGSRSIASPAGNISPGLGLEGDDDVGELEVSLLLQVSQYSCAEEDLTLAHTVEVGVQLQGLDLQLGEDLFY